MATPSPREPSTPGPPAAPDAYAEGLLVVLHRTQDLVNIAGTARAMLNMGLRRLRLVRPAEFDERRILGIAHGAEPVLARTEFFDTLDAALADAGHVVGTTARRRTAPYVWQTPREAAPELVARALSGPGPVALVFGPEDTGLTNEELDRCDRLLTIPADPRHASLNLAQAVLLIAYELWLAGPGGTRPLPRHRKAAPPATAQELEELFRDVEATLTAIDFFKGRNPPAILRTLRAVARRAQLDAREARLLRAIAIEARKHAARGAPRT